MYIKKWSINIIKNTNKDSERKYVKDIKIFLEKRIKGKKNAKKDIKILLRKKKKKGVSIIKQKLPQYKRDLKSHKKIHKK